MKFKTREEMEIHQGAVMGRQALREGWPMDAATRKTYKQLIAKDDAMMKRDKATKPRATAPKKTTKK